jgi:hypothetical protein
MIQCRDLLIAAVRLRRFAMNTRVVRCGAVAAALLLSVCLTGWLLANDAPADAKVDFAAVVADDAALRARRQAAVPPRA